MKIEYSVSEEDFIAFGRMSMTSSSTYKNARWLGKFYTVLIAIVALLMFSNTLKGITDIYRWTVLTIVFVYFAWIFLTSNNREKLRIEKHLYSLIEGKKSLGVLGKAKLELLEDSLFLSVEGCDSYYRLFRVIEIVDCPEHVLIHLGQTTEILPRKKIESGDLNQFIEALKSKGIASSTFIEEYREKIQPGIYVFILAAISFIPALLGYALYSEMRLARFVMCLDNEFLNSSCWCICNLRLQEIFFLCAPPVFLILLATSLYMFYKNWKRAKTFRADNSGIKKL